MPQAPPLAEHGAAACYICQLADTPGRFLPDKAVALGVPKGPLFGRLKAGNAVQTATGCTVEPAEVCTVHNYSMSHNFHVGRQAVQ